MRFRAVLFDLDGTLLNSLVDLAESMNESLARLGLPPHALDSYKRFVGDGVRVLAERALPAAARDEATLERCLGEMRRIYSRRWARTTRPYPGIDQLLDGLVERDLAFAVLSNKPDDFTRAMVEHFFGRGRFAVVRGATPTLPRKPDPAAARAIAADLGVAVGEVLYLGDTDTDMATARGARMYPVGALWGFRSASELLAAGAAVLVAGPTDVLRILD